MPALDSEVSRRDLFLDALDEPRHALEYGGINGEATIQGVPTGTADRPGEQGYRNKKLGVVMEPIPVLLRDAVTIDTAVRLTGISRLTLQNAAAKGALPVLKTGPGTSPYLVRIRDVVTYLITMWTERRARKEAGGKYVGFPSWLVDEVEKEWPPSRLFRPGNWESREVKINRGGRPRGYSPKDIGRPGYSVNGVKLGRKPRTDPAEKATPPEENHPPAASDVPSDVSPEPTTPAIDRSRLPKWHPLWRRSGT